MSTLLALDPGIRGCGVALFRDYTLTAAAYLKNPVTKGDEPEAVLAMANEVVQWDLKHGALDLIFEHPRIYTVSKSKGDNNDLLPLVGVDYAVAVHFGRGFVRRVYPQEWKGTMPKDVCHARVISRLTESERKVLDSALTVAGSKGHNVVDACGIGLFGVGRFERLRAWEQ
jgi:hypothetical protein